MLVLDQVIMFCVAIFQVLRVEPNNIYALHNRGISLDQLNVQGDAIVQQVRLAITQP